MKRMLLLGAAMLLAMPVAAFAQDKPTVAGAGLSPNMTDAPQATAADPAVAPSGMGPGSPAEAASNASGADTGVTPGTPDGQKSTIPHSTTIAEAPSASQAAAGAIDRDTLFTSVPSADDLSSSVIGLDIYNKDKADIGTIKDIAFGPNGVRAYIVGVGGFLGIGDRYVAIRPSALTLTYSADDKKWHAEMDTNAVQLTAAPEFKYPANS